MKSRIFISLSAIVVVTDPFVSLTTIFSNPAWPTTNWSGLIVIAKSSFPSLLAFASIVAISNDADVSFARIVTFTTFVKSVPSWATPVYTNSTTKSSVGAWSILTVYKDVVSPSRT